MINSLDIRSYPNCLKSEMDIQNPKCNCKLCKSLRQNDPTWNPELVKKYKNTDHLDFEDSINEVKKC